MLRIAAVSACLAAAALVGCGGGTTVIERTVVTSPPATATSTTTATSQTTAAPAEQTFIPCLDTAGTTYTLVSEPESCTIFSYEGSFAGGVNLESIRWRDWGQDLAQGEAVEKGFHTPPEHASVRISAANPVQACGRRVYSQLESTGANGTTRVRLHTCGGSAGP